MVDILEAFWRLFCPPFQLLKLSLNELKVVLTVNTPLQKSFQCSSGTSFLLVLISESEFLSAKHLCWVPCLIDWVMSL